MSVDGDDAVNQVSAKSCAEGVGIPVFKQAIHFFISLRFWFEEATDGAGVVGAGIGICRCAGVDGGLVGGGVAGCEVALVRPVAVAVISATGSATSASAFGSDSPCAWEWADGEVAADADASATASAEVSTVPEVCELTGWMGVVLLFGSTSSHTGAGTDTGVGTGGAGIGIGSCCVAIAVAAAAASASATSADSVDAFANAS